MKRVSVLCERLESPQQPREESAVISPTLQMRTRRAEVPHLWSSRLGYRLRQSLVSKLALCSQQGTEEDTVRLLSKLTV